MSEFRVRVCSSHLMPSLHVYVWHTYTMVTPEQLPELSERLTRANRTHSQRDMNQVTGNGAMKVVTSNS